MAMKLSKNWEWKQQKQEFLISYSEKKTNLIKNEWEVGKSFIENNFLNFYQKWQFWSWVFVGHSFLSDSELDWTPLMLQLPNAPGTRSVWQGRTWRFVRKAQPILMSELWRGMRGRQVGQYYVFAPFIIFLFAWTTVTHILWIHRPKWITMICFKM